MHTTECLFYYRSRAEWNMDDELLHANRFRLFDGASRSDASGSSRAIRANGYQIYIKRIVGAW